MRYSKDLNDFLSEKDSAVTLGKFDGLHRGHQKLIKEVLKLQNEGFTGVVFNIAPDCVPFLLTPDEKKQKLEEMGIDWMIRCPFVPEILSMEPEDFVEKILVGQIRAKHIIVGTDYRFGHDRKGDVLLLGQLQSKYGYQLHVIEKERLNDRVISSTYVKEALAKGEMELVENLLGYAYPISGTVQYGKQIGRTIGIPTVNQVTDVRKLLPPNGVYFSDVACGKFCWHGMTNIGRKPTVDGSFIGIETYIYDINRNLYGTDITVSVRKYKRPEQKFDSIHSLQLQMEADIEAGREFFS